MGAVQTKEIVWQLCTDAVEADSKELQNDF